MKIAVFLWWLTLLSALHHKIVYRNQGCYFSTKQQISVFNFNFLTNSWFLHVVLHNSVIFTNKHILPGNQLAIEKNHEFHQSAVGKNVKKFSINSMANWWFKHLWNKIANFIVCSWNKTANFIDQLRKKKSLWFHQSIAGKKSII